jgi:hypothetical protein
MMKPQTVPQEPQMSLRARGGVSEAGGRVPGITGENIEWAQGEAQRLRGVAHTPITDSSTMASHRGGLVGAIEFLRLKAGVRSEFYLRAADAVKRFHVGAAAAVVAEALLAWVDFAERGIAEVPVEAQARVAAATDLMEQVEQLLQERRVHPAAPVMLAGAALEEMLRSMVDTAGAKPKGRAGISSYTNALREVGAISAQEVKDLASWAGMRNNAAHGDFGQIELPNARLMAQGINLFIQKHSP